MFVHLRLHTEFSVADGTCRIDDAINTAKADGQVALAITDLNNLFGTVKFYSACRLAGIKPLIGAEISVRLADEDLNAEPAKLLLLVQNHKGYLNLCELLTKLWTQDAVRTHNALDWRWLEGDMSEGLVALSGAQAGPLGPLLIAGNIERAQTLAAKMSQLFPDRFFIELQRAGRPDDERYISAAVDLVQKMGLPLIATHPIQFIKEDDFESHEARVCIAQGEILGNPKRPKRFTRKQFFPSAQEMVELFADLPSAVANANAVAMRCNLSLTLGKPQLPAFPTPLVNGSPVPTDDYFRSVSFQGLESRLLHLFPDPSLREAKRSVYEERLNFEIETILKMGFPGYFLIVSDFINWAKSHGCPVGPGRGSGAGSLVAYALKITDLDPLQYNLLFERFLNPERVSMPDFDIDFCQTNRDRVIEYVKNQYGREAVSQIVTFGTMAARAAIRDVGRTLDMSYPFCEGLSKLIPNKPGQHMTIAIALEQEPQLAQRMAQEDEVKILLNLAQKLEGLTRNVGMHAGGVLIAPGKLTDFCPLYQQPGSPAAVSQFDKDDVESIGLVKFDFLGLATLTILEMAKNLIAENHPAQSDFSYDDIPLNDAPTYQLFADGKTEAVFQFESRGMQAMLRDAKPTRLEDLIVLNALFRPGPMSLIPSFVARKHGREKVEYPHPLAEPILAETYGIMVYQEQVMQTAQVLGGYSLGGADLLRRAMGKKKADEMALHRSIFREGASKNNISTEQADAIFDLMEEFAGYGFNKSHAAAYSLLAYQTAWIKVHFTSEFFSANMTVEMDDTDKLKILFDDAQSMGIQFDRPDINAGVYAFVPLSKYRIRYGLGAIKGTGQSAIEAICEARAEGGPFNSLFDFCARVDRSRINKRAVEALVKSGAFDGLGDNRAQFLASVGLAFEYAQTQTDHVHQVGLFDVEDSHGSSKNEPALEMASQWGVREKLTHEKAAVGFHLSGHLFEEAQAELRQFLKTKLSDLSESKEPQWVTGIVRDERTINTAKGRLTIFLLDDMSACLEVSADDAVFTKYKNLIKEDLLLVARVKVQVDRRNSSLRLTLIDAMDLTQARCQFGKYVRLSLGAALPDIATLLTQYPPRPMSGSVPDSSAGLGMRLNLHVGGSIVELQLGQRACFFPTDAALQMIASHPSVHDMSIVYD
jgi:DNA polymerase III subunit alpha